MLKMTARPPIAAGFTLVELMIGITIMGILMAMAVPAFSTWMANIRLRGVADSIQNGLQLARASAIQRNTSVRFQLVDNLTGSCALSTTGQNWLVSIDDPSSLCNVAPSDTTTPRILYLRSAAESGGNISVSATASNVSFTGLGRTATALTVQITNPALGNCVSSGGPVRCLNVLVTTGGQIRMCDPAHASTDPQGC